MSERARVIVAFRRENANPNQSRMGVHPWPFVDGRCSALLSLFLVRQMVFQACNHPFVLQMDYAFQTELHAIIVLNLVTTGNLQVSTLPAKQKKTDGD